MGSGTPTPTYTSTGDVLFGGKKNKYKGLGGFESETIDESLLPGGKEFYESFMKQYREGLPEDINNIYTKQGKAQIGSSLEEGRQNLTEQLAGSGASGIPIDALISGNARLQSGANQAMTGLTDKLAMANYGAKRDAFNDYANLIGLATGQGTSKNAYAMQQYQIDKDKEFSWGDALGSTLGAGGLIGGSAIGRKK